ncbi:MAG TPA: mechanosensitive ion channel family protein, partial [Polyangiaceae bacterium]|nr:mechanosensitive ion channel family protein [Polyangiaceae bacterium]
AQFADAHGIPVGDDEGGVIHHGCLLSGRALRGTRMASGWNRALAVAREPESILGGGPGAAGRGTRFARGLRARLPGRGDEGRRAALAIAGLALLLTVRFVGLFFRSVARGETQLAWLAPDLAPATSLLLRGAMVVCCLIFVAPVVTGDARGALSISGWLLFIVVGLGALPLCASALVGISLLFGRRVKAGDWIELGERAGRVTELGLFDLQILGEGQTVARVPYLLLLTRTLQVSPGGPRVRVVMTLESPTDLAETLDRVLQAIAQVGTEPRVEVDELTSRSLRFSISVTSDAAQASAQLCQAALAAAKDVQSAPVREAVA